jgi:hypothetical protein
MLGYLGACFLGGFVLAIAVWALCEAYRTWREV